MVEIKDLIPRARRKYREKLHDHDGEYWYGVLRFLLSQQGKGRGDRSQKQNNWLHSIREELWEPGD